MNLEKLYQILVETTGQFRKGEEKVERQEAGGALKVVELFAMPHESQSAGLELVDLHFVKVGVDRKAAEERKPELVKILADYPQPDRLLEGPSYIEVGGVLGDQGAAFQLFALGKVLGLWDVITPESLHVSGEAADQMAGQGFIMMSPYDCRRSPADDREAAQ